MLAPSKAVIEDTWEWLRAVLMLRPWSWFISPGQLGFVRVDNQFGNSPFYSGAAWVWVFFWRMYGLPTLPFFLFPILYEEKLELLFADISGSIFTEGSLWKQIHCCCIFITILFALRKERMCEW
jgi:hypothetical protein